MKNNKMFIVCAIILLVIALVTSVTRMDVKEIKNEIISISETIERENNAAKPSTRIDYGVVTAIDEDANTIELTDEDGEMWVVEVSCASDYDLNGYYRILFDTMGTDTIYDDKIVELHREAW